MNVIAVLIGELRNAYKIETVKGRGHLGDLGIGGRLLLKWILEKWDMRMWTGFNWVKIGSIGGLCELSNELSH
jgi:hypothetical protein